MAYNKAFNPDALPAHPQPDQAAQAFGQLSINRKPSPIARPSSQSPLNLNQSQIQHQPALPSGRRPSPAAIAAQQASRTHPPAPQNEPIHNPHSQNYHRINSPPPPANYGYGPRPQIQPGGQSYASQPSKPSPRAPTVPPPDPDSAELHPLFQAANVSRTGALTTQELGSALVNADFTPFDSMTIRSLMRMFSTSPPWQPQGPTITFNEFQNLWRFLAAWRELFERFDEDHSGRISLGEFSKALVAFGYRLSQPFISLLYNSYNDRGIRANDERRGSRGQVHGQGMSFDLFVQACISLKRMTDVFKGYDEDRDGFITVSFEEFLTEILKLRE